MLSDLRVQLTRVSEGPGQHYTLTIDWNGRSNTTRIFLWELFPTFETVVPAIANKEQRLIYPKISNHLTRTGIYTNSSSSSDMNLDKLYLKTLHPFMQERQIFILYIETSKSAVLRQNIRWGPTRIFCNNDDQYLCMATRKDNTIEYVDPEWYDVDTLRWKSTEYEYLAREIYE